MGNFIQSNPPIEWAMKLIPLPRAFSCRTRSRPSDLDVIDPVLNNAQSLSELEWISDAVFWIRTQAQLWLWLQRQPSSAEYVVHLTSIASLGLEKKMDRVHRTHIDLWISTDWEHKRDTHTKWHRTVTQHYGISWFSHRIIQGRIPKKLMNDVNIFLYFLVLRFWRNIGGTRTVWLSLWWWTSTIKLLRGLSIITLNARCWSKRNEIDH